MAWMAGWIGPILAVRLLGRASIYLMAPVSQAFQLAWTNRTMSLARGQMGSLCVARIRSRVSGEAVGASLAPAGRLPRAEAGGRRGQCRVPRHRLADVLRRCLAGLVVHAYVARRQNRQYVLVSGVLVGLSGTVCRLNGLGSRGLDPTLLQRCNAARLRSPQAR